nr:hypothetical protein [Tanacetum cinerariifolium]
PVWQPVVDGRGGCSSGVVVGSMGESGVLDLVDRETGMFLGFAEKIFRRRRRWVTGGGRLVAGGGCRKCRRESLVWVGPVGKFKEVEVDADNAEEESNTEGDYTMDSDSEDLDYDPNHADMFDDDERIVEKVHVTDSLDLDDGIDYERRMQLRELEE